MIRILWFLGLCAIIEKSNGDQKVVQYLMQYGYLEPPKVGDPPDSFSDDEYESALKMAQKFAGIPGTGKFDNQTREMLIAPRCGVPDTGPRLKRFGTASSWATRQISYSFINYSPKYSRYDIETTFRKAFDVWARSTGLQFNNITSNTADIQIGFFSRDHGDGNPFDGPLRILAHAFHPGPGLGGDIHVDDDENFSLYDDNDMGAVSLLCTVIHELGHALGLKHSLVPGAIMRPRYSRQIELGEDDILGIQALYGA